MAGPNGALGTVQWGTGMLTVYGCTRQGAQVVCDTDYNNQNQNQTHVENNWWRDAYVVDQFGDRHVRASAYFVNGEGQPRESIDIPYGQGARYILVFNDVSPNVTMVGLHSAYGPMNIENIGLDGGAGAANSSGGQTDAANGASSAGTGASNGASNAANGAKDTLKNTGKQRAGEAQDKLMKKGNDSLQKMMDKIPH